MFKSNGHNPPHAQATAPWPVEVSVPESWCLEIVRRGAKSCTVKHKVPGQHWCSSRAAANRARHPGSILCVCVFAQSPCGFTMGFLRLLLLPLTSKDRPLYGLIGLACRERMRQWDNVEHVINGQCGLGAPKCLFACYIFSSS